ncbi:MAG TPA: hypothetical protein VLF66_10075 [Thermoanaerobaculia bacterium]|nr:hypothetical protein [Thermoanaerobaculia bacterium]
MDSFSNGQVGVMLANLLLAPRRPADWFANARNAFDPFEPDNAPEIARVIGLGETQERSFHWDYLGRQNDQEVFQKCDEDWVRFALTQPTPVEIFTAELDGPPRPNTILSLFDADLNLLAQNDDAPLAGGFSRIDRTLPPGVYFLQVTNKSGADDPDIGESHHPDSRGHYLLTVRRCPDCCFNLALSGVQQLNPGSGPFNLGAREAAWTDFLPNDLDVTGVALTFNADRPLDFGGPGVPPRQSHLTAQLCDGADLTFRSGGRLEVGDAGSAGLRADVRVGVGSVLTLSGGSSGTVHAGSRLIVGSGGRLVLEDGGALGVRPNARVAVEAGGVLEIRSRGHLAAFGNGRVTVLPGGRLVYRPRAEIRLEGDGAVLDLRGDLEIDRGALFTFSYQDTSGFVRFELPAKGCTPKPDYLACPNVQVNGPAQMLFRGSGREDKILEIAAPLHPEAALLRLTVVQGRVELAEEGEIQIDQAQLVVNNVDFVGAGGGIALDWPFVFINNQPLLFDGVGVRARGNGAAGPVLTIRNSEFRNGSLPLFTQDLAVRLENVRMSGHTYGWLGSPVVGQSEVVDTVIEGGGVADTGLDLLEGTGATVRVVRSEITGHQLAGVQVVGDIRVEVE